MKVPPQFSLLLGINCFPEYFLCISLLPIDIIIFILNVRKSLQKSIDYQNNFIISKQFSEILK